MVHESAKTAAWLDGLLNDPERQEQREAHPWADELASYEHWGMYGGAERVGEMNYAELRRAGHHRRSGLRLRSRSSLQEAAVTFSRHWGGKLTVIKFDDGFRPGWDLADEVPEELITKAGTARYPLRNYMIPATWATVQVAAKGKGRPGHVLGDAFKDEWFRAVDPEQYHHVSLPNFSSLSRNGFNRTVRPFSGVDDTASWSNNCFTARPCE